MEIPESITGRVLKPVLIRVSPELHQKLEELAEVAGGGVATVARSILEVAIAEGVEVVPAPRKDLSATTTAPKTPHG